MRGNSGVTTGPSDAYHPRLYKFGPNKFSHPSPRLGGLWEKSDPSPSLTHHSNSPQAQPTTRYAVISSLRAGDTNMEQVKHPEPNNSYPTLPAFQSGYPNMFSFTLMPPTHTATCQDHSHYRLFSPKPLDLHQLSHFNGPSDQRSAGLKHHQANGNSI